jgi:hypothetical protein
MRVNRGGQLAPADIYGRDRFIEDLWRELEQTSVVLTAERRTGKTCVIKKMHASRPDGVLTFFQDLEGVYSASEFLEEVLRCVHPELSRGAQARTALQRLMETIGGTEIAGVLRLPEAAQAEWKGVLPNLLENLLEHHPGQVIFFWDEFPQMLYNIAQADPADAMAVLDLLRSLRQHHSRLRFVLTGSIGFHSVIAHLQRRGYRNAPKNDMFTALLPPLAENDAVDLAKSLLAGEGIEVADLQGVAAEIAAEAGCIPFYVHQIVGGLRGRPHVASGTARQVVDEGLRAPHDPWELRHYRTRIDHDYEESDRAYALAVLDTVAVADAGLAFAELARLAKARPGVTDDEQLRTVLKHLEQDHYLTKSAGTGAYSFRTGLIGRWWRLERDL